MVSSKPRHSEQTIRLVVRALKILEAFFGLLIVVAGYIIWALSPNIYVFAFVVRHTSILSLRIHRLPVSGIFAAHGMSQASREALSDSFHIAVSDGDHIDLPHSLSCFQFPWTVCDISGKILPVHRIPQSSRTRGSDGAVHLRENYSR